MLILCVFAALPEKLQPYELLQKLGAVPIRTNTGHDYLTCRVPDETTKQIGYKAQGTITVRTHP
ncbi:hypothetical protein Cni_G00914 [Canna indica]|uniref:Uncharacterized protein n=1 Tax=Canna indica TaxID=4628 RepID=A0AAQ3JLU6_9LILI|nr:hypothetical protein Cni_G00914 [Canna indica]